MEGRGGKWQEEIKGGRVKGEFRGEIGKMRWRN